MASTARSVLRQLAWLQDVPDEVVDALASRAHETNLTAGEVLYRQGEPSTELAVVLSGRLRASSEGEGSAAVDQEIGRGEPVGEMGVLIGGVRSATVIAVRDSVVLRLDQAALDEAMSASAVLGRTLMGVVADRLRRPVMQSAVPTVVGLLPLQGGALDADAIDDLARAVGRSGVDAVVPGRDGVADPGSADDLRHLIDRVEEEDGLLLVPLDDRRPGWDDMAGRQVDHLLLTAPAEAVPGRGAAATRLLQALEATGVTPRQELVLTHRADRRLPTGVPRWMDETGVAHVHHVRQGDGSDVDRLARHLLGRTVGLVLSGGGARAMAHLGAYRALVEAGVPIDRVGGSSIGGVIAAQIATGAPPDELIAQDRAEFQAADFGRRWTLPVVSIFSIRRALALFDHLFGTRDLLDAWIPSFVTVVDFTACSLVVRDRGPAALWARATASPPGLWPPVAGDDGHLFVDGGVLDNLPVLAMQERGADTVLAVNVSSRKGLSVAESDRGVTSWSEFVVRFAQTRRPPTFPSLVPTMMRLGLVTSLQAQAAAIDAADLCVDPEVGQVNMADYGRFDEVVAAGYRAMARALEDQPLTVPGQRATP